MGLFTPNLNHKGHPRAQSVGQVNGITRKMMIVLIQKNRFIFILMSEQQQISRREERAYSDISLMKSAVTGMMVRRLSDLNAGLGPCACNRRQRY